MIGGNLSPCQRLSVPNVSLRAHSRDLRCSSGLKTSGQDALDVFTGRSGPAGVTGITHDSRFVRPGDLYAALPGARVHGARFCADAAAAGAVAVLTDADGRERAVQAGLPVFVVADPRARLGEVAAWIYGYPSEQLLLIGVTGTSGKTTTTFLLESGLRAAGYQTGLIGGVADPDRRRRRCPAS